MKQANNAVELMAALHALQLHTTRKIAICSDSKYVLLGICGAAKRWRVKGGWVHVDQSAMSPSRKSCSKNSTGTAVNLSGSKFPHT